MAKASVNATAAKALDGAQLLAGYEQMLSIRLFEEEMQRLFVAGHVHGTIHLYIGQEAVSAGICGALQPQDWIAATYRGHGAALAKGSSAEGLAAELLGRATGTCAGRAGSMNIIDLEHGLVGCFGIVGGSIGAATGAGLSSRREGKVAVAFFGDGAANQAYFHECLNFAAIYQLPVLYVCENNLYGEFTPMAQVTAGGDIAARAAVLAIPTQKVDGNDYGAVFEAAVEAVDRLRAGQGPEFIECLTYRHLGHSRSDPGAYRPHEEVESWLSRDPLRVARRRLEEEFAVPASDIAGVEEHARSSIDRAIRAALEAPFPDPAEQAATEYAEQAGTGSG